MIYDIAIIGAGAAGLTAGIYGVRSGLKTVIFESLVAGGQIINSSKIDNYPAAPHISGLEFSQTLEKQALELGAEIIFEEVAKISPENNMFRVLTDDDSYNAKTIIIATGTKPRKLGLDREDFFIGDGLSYCATCDGSFYKNKTVAVVGGGNSALHEALYLSSIAQKVYVIHRRATLRAAKHLINAVECCDNVEFLLDSTITGLEGDKKLESVKLNNGKKLTIDGLFVSIGREPNASHLIDGLNINKDGFILADESCKTNISGIFVAGDVRDKSVRQLVTATSDGAMAAEAAISFLKR